jgi:HK97 family phage major capsid protein
MPPGGMSAAPYGTLMGRPVVPIEQCQTLGTVGDILFCDWSEYLWCDKGSLESASSMHVQFLTGEMVYRFTFRCDGQPAWNSALTPFKGSATQSPFISLATRS